MTVVFKGSLFKHYLILLLNKSRYSIRPLLLQTSRKTDGRATQIHFNLIQRFKRSRRIYTELGYTQDLQMQYMCKYKLLSKNSTIVLDPYPWTATILQYRLKITSMESLGAGTQEEAGLSYSGYNCPLWEPENWWGLLIYSSATMCWRSPQWTSESPPWAFELGIGPSMVFRLNNCTGMQSNQPSRRPWESYWKVLRMGTSSFSWTSKPKLGNNNHNKNHVQA